MRAFPNTASLAEFSNTGLNIQEVEAEGQEFKVILQSKFEAKDCMKLSLPQKEVERSWIQHSDPFPACRSPGFTLQHQYEQV